jgi:carboxyl-terminal processing protease
MGTGKLIGWYQGKAKDMKKRSGFPWLAVSISFLVTLIITSALLTAGFGWAQEARPKDTGKDTNLYRQLRLLNEALNLITTRYVEEVDAKELIYGAINGMTQTLDPHSQFLDEQHYEDLMVTTEGKFGGLGILISIRDGVLTVISPIDGTPASAVGIQGGDKIVRIQGKSTRGITVNEAVEKLRGVPGTEVTITISREGVEGLIDYTIVRDVIKISSVMYSYMIDDDIAYARVSRFTKTSADELYQAIKELEADNEIHGLILDLRRNPGGLLEQAVEVADLFTDKGDLIVYTEGRRPMDNRRFYAERRAEFGVDYPTIVLVNHESASASEIVAGAIQDWDRGLVVGKTTFGKGSVQTVLQLSRNTALKLTTALYYTPSGRCINTDDEDLIEVISADTLISDDETPGEDGAESEVRPIFRTKGGRIVYGGGGITPDIEIEQTKLSKLMTQVERKTLFFKFAVSYSVEHPEIERDFEVTEDMLTSFVDMMSDEEIEYTQDEFAENREELKRGIKREIVRKLWGDVEAYKVYAEGDPQLIAAVDLFREADTLPTLLSLAETYGLEVSKDVAQ